MSTAFLEASGLHRQLGFVLRQAYTAVWQDLIRTLEPFGLKPQTYATLLLVEATPGCKQQDVADALDIQRPNIVALIDRLVEAGWLRRETNPSDRRSYALSLTEAGNKLLAESRAAHEVHEARTAALLENRDTRTLVAACARLAKLQS
jgi:DNA-binding MarR family transcriptional regulator